MFFNDIIKSMGKITVWTKQHENVLKELKNIGRYIAKKKYIILDLQEHADIVLEAYQWLVKNTPNSNEKPKDAEFPVWVSFSKDATMLLSEKTIILELKIEESLITKINIMKWGMILNYEYLPENEFDEKRHKKLLEDYRISDTQAYMSQFYPHIKREIIESWKRLFDNEDNKKNNSQYYGNIWEIKEQWIKKIIR